ncbi:potassium channel protein [Rhodopirellula maiorica SM1]|uniref:Potassium channel protein n=1 Tax=Rhodopirellula maiorica SM1 TaxID=1265738 RepID=M5RUI7_9BACT|nr:potassium channel protein [Rhodopirellula maiorica SM1]
MDLAIILLPLVSFLRSLQFLRATGITKMVRLSQINQVARMYRLRGTALKAVRALVLLDMLERILRPSPERSLVKLHAQLAELEKEAKAVRRKIAKLEREIPVEMCAEE